jgi:hypothetical protein
VELNIEKIISAINSQIKKFILWNKEKWSSGGKERWKVIFLWLFVIGFIGQMLEDDTSPDNSPTKVMESHTENEEPVVSSGDTLTTDKMFRAV